MLQLLIAISYILLIVLAGLTVHTFLKLYKMQVTVEDADVRSKTTQRRIEELGAAVSTMQSALVNISERATAILATGTRGQQNRTQQTAEARPDGGLLRREVLPSSKDDDDADSKKDGAEVAGQEDAFLSNLARLQQQISR